jgi:hypothetical protein
LHHTRPTAMVSEDTPSSPARSARSNSRRSRPFSARTGHRPGSRRSLRARTGDLATGGAGRGRALDRPRMYVCRDCPHAREAVDQRPWPSSERSFGWSKRCGVSAKARLNHPAYNRSYTEASI